MKYIKRYNKRFVNEGNITKKTSQYREDVCAVEGHEIQVKEKDLELTP